MRIQPVLAAIRRTVRRAQSAIGNRQSAMLLCLSLSGAMALAAPSPFLIPFQGRLTNPQGVPYTNGQYTITYNLYDQAVGGSNLWTETHYKVGVINGMVNVFLGSINTMTNVSFAQTLHLGITIDADGNPNTADPEMIPRQMIVPPFYAKKAENADKLAGYDWGVLLKSGSDPMTGVIKGSKIENGGISSNQIAPGAIDITSLNAQVQLLLKALQTPAGSVTAFAGTNIPSGWLPCDGSYVSTDTYSNLFSVVGFLWGTGTNGTTFRLPDLRGVFLRGINGTRSDSFTDPDSSGRVNIIGQIVGNQVGSYQGSLFQSHNHGGGNHSHSITTFGHYNCATGDFDMAAWGSGGQTGNSGNIISPEGGAETRPKNAYVNYIIKY